MVHGHLRKPPTLDIIDSRRSEHLQRAFVLDTRDRARIGMRAPIALLHGGRASIKAICLLLQRNRAVSNLLIPPRFSAPRTISVSRDLFSFFFFSLGVSTSTSWLIASVYASLALTTRRDCAYLICNILYLLKAPRAWFFCELTRRRLTVHSIYRA